MILERLTFNLDTPAKRVEMLEGRSHLVVPMVMMVEGVLNGSGGPLFYPGDEIAKTPAVWNHKPIVVYHPQANGQGVSACSPEVINTRKIGVIMNTKASKVKKGDKEVMRLNAEAWLEVDRAKTVDPRVLTAVETNKMMEVSTGLFTDNTVATGEFEGKAYTSIARNYRPDHLAILPDQLGACSIADGAGLMRNSAGKYVENDTSYDDIRSALSGLIRRKKGDRYDGWIEDVYPGYFVYTFDGHLYRQSYNVTDGTVTLVGEAVEVVRETVYKPKTVTNSEVKENSDMDRKTQVDALIKNTANGWAEGDREFLVQMADDKFAKLIAPVAAPTGNAEGTPAPSPLKVSDPAAVAAAAAAGAAGVPNVPAPTGNAAPAPVKAMTDEEFIANAPPRMRDLLNNAQAIHNQQRAELITVIVANKANQFTQAQLEAKETAELGMLANLARAGQPAPAPAPVANYWGAAGAAPIGNAGGAAPVQAPLPQPVMNFGAK